MKETKSIANQIIGMIITIYKWAQINNIYKGENPAKLVKYFKDRKIKAKLSDGDRDKMLEHVEGKAFDYQPHFYTCLGMHYLKLNRRPIKKVTMVSLLNVKSLELNLAGCLLREFRP